MIITFSFDSKFGKFCDALHLPDNHTLTEQEIETMKKERFNNWLAIVDVPPSEE